LRDDELAFLPQSAQNYVNDSREYYGLVPGPEKHGRDDYDLEETDDGTELG
jgi:hypothetical protein